MRRPSSYVTWCLCYLNPPTSAHAGPTQVESELWGFVTPATVKTEPVVAAASLIQPYYAVPTKFIAMDDFPYTSNGKIDKRALRQMALDEIARARAEKERALAITKPEFYAPSPYDGRLLADLLTALPQPLPAYQQDAKVDAAAALAAVPVLEKHGASVSSSSSSSTIGPIASPEKSEVSSAHEAGNFWDGYMDDALPEKTHGRALRNLRHRVFSLYRRLFGVVFVANAAVFVATLARGGADAQRLGLIVVANLFCAILMRQDYVINAFFTVACSVPNT